MRRTHIFVLSLLAAGCSVPIDTGLGAAKKDTGAIRSGTESPPLSVDRTELQDAEERLRLAESEARVSPGSNPALAIAFRSVAQTQMRLGNTGEALQLLARALKLNEEAYGRDHPKVAETLTSQAAVLYKVQRYDEAEIAFVRALKIRKNRFGENHRATGLSTNNLAFFYAGRERFDEADPLFIESIRILDNAAEASDAERIRARDNYAAMLLDAGRIDDAAAIRSAVEGLRSKDRSMKKIIEKQSR